MGGGTWDSNPDQWEASTRGHCGLEANVTDPDTGVSMLMYIGDAFDDTWVRVSDLILFSCLMYDIMPGSFYTNLIFPFPPIIDPCFY